MTLSPLIAEWKTTAPDAWEAYEERIAICVLDGRLPLARAEDVAERCTREEWARRPGVSAISPLSGRVRSPPVARKGQ